MLKTITKKEFIEIIEREQLQNIQKVDFEDVCTGYRMGYITLKNNKRIPFDINRKSVTASMNYLDKNNIKYYY